MPIVAECEVLANDEVVHGHYRLRVYAPEIARRAKAGQFAMVEVSDSLAPFLRRPMSFERIYPEGTSMLYKVEGEGTKLLSRLRPGQKLSVQGPLGNGFPVDADCGRIIIAGGGIGVAPLPGLVEAILKTGAKPPEVIVAARTRNLLLCVEDFRRMDCTVYVATDDGTAGMKAYASEVLKTLNPTDGTRVCACGPMAMMRTVSEVALATGAECLVSLEAQMACGDGVCLGCVVESKEEKEGEKMVRVCVDGPVFDSRRIDWKAHKLAYDP